MKKVNFLFYIIPMLVFQTWAGEFVNKFNLAYKNKLYYSSYYYLRLAIVNNEEKINEDAISEVLSAIHPSIYIQDARLDQYAENDTSIDYAVGVRKFFQKDFGTAKNKLKKIGSNSQLFMEASFFLGLISVINKDNHLAVSNFRDCVKFMKKKKRYGIKQNVYIQTFANRCLQQMSRALFAEKKYQQSLKTLQLLNNKDYIWPRTLIDLAWNYYWLKDFPRALGTVVSYKAPLLQRFMIPEASYLRGLIYFENCYFAKVDNIINEYEKNTFNNRKAFTSRNSEELLRIFDKDRKTFEESSPELPLYNFLSSYKNDTRYQSYIAATREIEKELVDLKRITKTDEINHLDEFLKDSLRFIKSDFTLFLSDLLSDYVNQIESMQVAFTHLKLALNIKRRAYLYENQTDEFTDAFDNSMLKNVSNISGKAIWDFRGGFWADELGSYAIAINNRCKKK